MRRNQRLFVPVTAGEKQMIVHLTEESGLTIAALVRQMIREQYRMQVRSPKQEQPTQQ